MISLSRKLPACARSSLAFAIIALATLAGSPALGQDDFLITLRDGSILRAKVNLGAIPWSRIDPSGTVSADQLRLESVRKIELARWPASRQLVEIRRHLANLQSDNYHTRNESEAALVGTGGQFIDVLNAARESANAEVRYRVGRVLKQLQRKDAKRVDADFDLVTLASGEVISGDLEFESLQVDFRGTAYDINRDTIFQITRLPLVEASAARKWTTQTFSKPAEQFFQAEDFHIDFDRGRLNETFAKFEDIHDSFVYRGARLRADCGAEPATIVTAGFAVDQGRSKKNSAATMMARNNKKYLGAVQIDFCEPGLADIPASVHRVGCYLALVDHPRDFVLDAFSADHQIVASAEALEKSAFVGVESTIPIAYVRVQPNRNLKVDPAEQDQNFVIDDLTFDPPRADPTLAREGQALLQTIDGSRLVCSSLEFDGNSFVARRKLPLTNDGKNEPLTFAPGEVAALTFWLSPRTSRTACLWGSFVDGSFLALAVDGEKISSRDFDQWTIDRSELAGVSGGNTTLRYPLAEDFAAKQTVIVRPAERWLVPAVDIGEDGMSWDPAKAELREVMHLENSSHAADPTSQFTLADAPSIWWELPSEPDSAFGWLHSIDGSKFTLNGPTQIQVENLDNEAITLSRAGQSIRIPWSEVIAVKFPLEK